MGLVPVLTCRPVARGQPSPAPLAGCPALIQLQLSDGPEPARSRTLGSLVTLAATTLVRSRLWLQESWVTHTQRVWQDTKSHQLVWKRMLSANAPGTGPALAPKPPFISGDLTAEEKLQVLSRSQFPRKYLFSLTQDPDVSPAPCSGFSTFPQCKCCRTRSSRAPNLQTNFWQG